MLQKLLEKVKKLKYEDMLISVSLLISKELDNKFEGLIGELGFDLGIDVNDDVWFFEANSKPGRSIFHHPKLLKNDNLTRECSLLYASYLAEKSFSNHLW
ncbi:MAG: yheD [Bacillales bacterium]|nr:yheD [Bacillales bacterium]